MSHQHPYQRRKRISQEFPEPFVSEEGHIRSLYLDTDTIQSSMDVRFPEKLVLAYTHVMMGWLLFTGDVNKVAHIGLGGGSIPRFIRKHFPKARQVAIEINPKVIAVARSLFNLPKENSLFEIIEADGAMYVKIMQKSADAIIVDGFDGTDIIQEFTEVPFFEDCKSALADEGFFVTNWWLGDPRYKTFVTRLEEVFDGRVIELPASKIGNAAVMAFKDTLPKERFDPENISKRVKELKDSGMDLDWEWILKSLFANNSERLKDFSS